MLNLILSLIKLQQTDSQIIEKRRFIDKVPLRIHEVDEPLKNAKAELEKIKQKSEALLKKKKEKERALEDINETIKKMKARAADLKTNKEYQAHLKEIESSEKEISGVEDQILQLMVDIDASQKEEQAREMNVKAETEKIDAFKTELSAEMKKHEDELVLLREERGKLTALLDADSYKNYLTLLESGKGLAIARIHNELCLGCNMNVPPQLCVEIKKNEDVIHCPQCRRILYYEEPQQ